jgi:DNA primase small subunit
VGTAATNVEGWKPETCPTIGQLLSELDDVRKLSPNETDGEHHSGNIELSCLLELIYFGIDWEKTSLKQYVDILEMHNAGLMDEVRRVKREGGGMGE